MKLLDVDAFAAINGLLGNGIRCPSTTLHGRIEAYSCKSVSKDKRLAKKLRGRSNLASPEQAPSPNTFVPGSLDDDDYAPLEPLEMQPSFESDVSLHPDESTDMQAIVSIITALNASFPDHDFSDLPLHSFYRENPAVLYEAVNQRIAEAAQQLTTEGIPDFQARMWTEIDAVLDLQNCEFFSFSPSMYESPIDGASWSSFYFILNKRHDVNKLCFFTLYGVAAHDEAMDIDVTEYVPPPALPYDNCFNGACDVDAMMAEDVLVIE